MAINRVEIRDFLVFKGEFAVDFCPGVNVLIGGNGTGKTTLLKTMYYGYSAFKSLFIHKKDNITTYWMNESEINLDYIPNIYEYNKENNTCLFDILGQQKQQNKIKIKCNAFSLTKNKIYDMIELQAVYIPEKDILEHSKGLLTFIEQKQTGFSRIYKDVLLNAQDIPTQKQSKTQTKISKMIVKTTGGTVHWDKGEGSFYTLHTDGTRIPFANEASGYKKLGFLGLLVTSGQMEKGAVLFWDEPENSLNPELMPVLTEILLELSRNGVQIFIATHSEILASYFAVNREKGDSVMFYSLYKKNKKIEVDINNRFDLLKSNNLTAEPVRLYEKELEKGLGNA
jgi:predicted ATP-dependent endonuclease of OLD family